MGLNDTPSGNRTHIGFFGIRNAGKSSVVNAVTAQDIAVVSDVRGTTTDPVYKSMELLPLGPVMIIDTPGYDDEGTLGEMRVRKARQVLNKTDIAVLVVDARKGLGGIDRELQELFKEKGIPSLTVWNKSDLLETHPEPSENEIYVSAETKDGIYELKEKLAHLVPSEEDRHLVADLIRPGNLVVLVIPIDKAAPKGRLILPEQAMIRDVLDAGAVSVVTQETNLAETLKHLNQKPALVITDSQAFGLVSKVTPEDVPLTSFSILMARFKGTLEQAVRGVAAIANLKDGDTVLISEGCTHHRQCNDIGTVKIPNWLRQFTGKDFVLETSSGTGFPDDLTKYAAIIHCGGCMLNEREMVYRYHCAEDQGVPITNYGTFIAYTHGILKRSLGIFPELAEMIPEK
ncbi:MAG: [FeFe] hydrogenase H-cluster maturation GTPase HydF [Lachnospiraceae bacterium]|jgi:[FeFe] hydrogenase H-cluster maturation GTPase HydF|nr:[FeFe] hydrogenase H-cluster maturation GTPase HydF [Lachnospiraceae bacterium]